MITEISTIEKDEMGWGVALKFSGTRIGFYFSRDEESKAKEFLDELMKRCDRDDVEYEFYMCNVLQFKK